MAYDQNGMITVVQCAECKCAWATFYKPRSSYYGTCGARDPGSFQCHGTCHRPAEPWRSVLDSTYAIGGWEAVKQIIDANPALGWYEGGARQPREPSVDHEAKS